MADSIFALYRTFFSRDFCKTELPAIAKIVKGQHSILGVPTLSNPSLQSTALFLYAGKRYQILAQPIKIKEGRKHSNVGELTIICVYRLYAQYNPPNCTAIHGIIGNVAYFVYILANQYAGNSWLAYCDR